MYVNTIFVFGILIHCVISREVESNQKYFLNDRIPVRDINA